MDEQASSGIRDRAAATMVYDSPLLPTRTPTGKFLKMSDKESFDPFWLGFAPNVSPVKALSQERGAFVRRAICEPAQNACMRDVAGGAFARASHRGAIARIHSSWLRRA